MESFMLKRNRSHRVLGYAIEPLEHRWLLSADLVPPKAVLGSIFLFPTGNYIPVDSGHPLISARRAPIQIQIRYTDNVALAIHSISAAQIQVFGPNGFALTGRPTSVDSSNGRVAEANYSIAAP